MDARLEFPSVVDSDPCHMPSSCCVLGTCLVTGQVLGGRGLPYAPAAASEAHGRVKQSHMTGRQGVEYSAWLAKCAELGTRGGLEKSKGNGVQVTAVAGRAKRLALNVSSLRGRKSHRLQSCFVGEVLTQSVGLARNSRMCHICSKWEKRWRSKREAQDDPVGCCMFCGEDMGPGLSIHRHLAGVRRWLLKEGPLGAELPDRSSCQPCSGGNAPCSSYPGSSYAIEQTLPPLAGNKEPMCFL